jgi:carboxyl-terminal processing protease
MSPFLPSCAPIWATRPSFDFMLPRKSLTTRSLIAFPAALIFAGLIVVRAQDTPPAPEVGNPLPASGAEKEPGGDQPKPTGTPSAAPNTPAEVSAPAGDDGTTAAPKQMVIRADRDYEIERTVGGLLENHHYLQRPIDAEMSRRWLGLYLAALDENHRIFLQSDVDEFTKKYNDTPGNTLGDLLHGEDEATAVGPAFEIFQRFLMRLHQDVSLAQKLIHEKHDFTKDESFTMTTDKSPWLKDEAASETLWRGYVKSDLLNGLLDKKPIEATEKRLTKNYDSLLRYWSEMDDLDVLEQYLCGLTHSYDPHSDYFQPDESENFSIQAIDHSVTGIGAQLKSDDGYAIIDQIISGGPADLDKRLKPMDRIIAVGQGTKEPVDAVNMRLNRVVDMIRGPKGSVVHLVIQPAGAGDAVHKDIILKRDLVSLKDSLAKADIIEHPVPGGGIEKIGVIHLHDFYNNTQNDHAASTDCAKLIGRLKKEKVAGIILDMRNNGGGLLDQAIDLTALFVKGQSGQGEPVVQVRRSDGDTESLKTENNSVLYSGPLVVLVNKMSASATEIVAAALQDYGRAVVVGDKSTHGKGTVQTLIRLDQAAPLGVILDPGNELKMTVQKFYRVAGGSTQEKGVVPDIVLPSLLDAFQLGETTLKYYLPYDTISAVPFDHYNLAAPYIAELKTKSDTRVADSTDFNYLRQDIAYYKSRVVDPTVSLNEATRLKETDQLKASALARKKDLESRKAGRDKDLELTLDMVDKNQPAAVAVAKKSDADDEDADEDDSTPDLEATINTPTVDPQLNETVNIMADYVNLLQGADKLVQNAPASTAATAPDKQSATTP